MRKWIDIGTDIATIGVWDPTRERYDLTSMRFAEYQRALESEAVAGRLFFINTSADGSYPAEFYVDETPDSTTLELYESPDRLFLILCHSGRLIAGGLEDFLRRQKSITSTEDEFSVAPGYYAIQLYFLIEERADELLRAELGESDYDYYARKSGQLPWGCFFALTVIVSALIFIQLWPPAIAMFCVGLCLTLVRYRSQTSDHRFKAIAKRVKEIERENPPFIYVLQPVSDPTIVSGGWFDLP